MNVLSRAGVDPRRKLRGDFEKLRAPDNLKQAGGGGDVPNDLVAVAVIAQDGEQGLCDAVRVT